jgi:uncharacterized protein (TIGR03000 family)
MRRFMAARGAVLCLQALVVAASAQNAGPSVAQLRSRFTVTVPTDDAELIVDGVAIRGKGLVRAVESVPLTFGRRYEYRFTARWRPNTYTVLIRNRTVRFTAGQDVAVDLTSDDLKERAEIKYVQTLDDVVDEMVRLAAVTPDDVVYEPGCGDARITIAAVKAGAGRGVGIDIDAARVAESRANVKAAGLADRIDIRLGDALDIKDLSRATVVFLFMGDEFDMLIRPMLWDRLSVGARVVSHRFKMGDWEPDKTVEVVDGELRRQVHLWTITREVKERADRRGSSASTQR